MPLAVNDVIQMTVLGLKDVQACWNVFHFQVGTAPSTGTPAENIAALITHLWDNATGVWFDKWLACLPDDYTLRSVRGQRVAPTRLAYVETLIVAAGTCVNLPTELSNVTWVFTKQSELAGRRGVGDTHMLFPSPEWATNGELNATGQTERTALMNLIDDQVTVAAGGVYLPIIYHPNFSPNFTRITHTTQKQQIRTMRRRTVGRGI